MKSLRSFREQWVLHLFKDKLSSAPNAKRRKGGYETQHYLKYLPATEKNNDQLSRDEYVPKQKTRRNAVFLCCMQRPSFSLHGKVFQSLPFECLTLGQQFTLLTALNGYFYALASLLTI